MQSLRRNILHGLLCTAFIYQGVFYYHSHERETKPTNFVLKREGALNLSVILPDGTVNN